jgi:branched-chain amino acid transport system permease protein
MLIAALVNGVVVGCIYALVAIGFTMIYNATETVNFAVGESLMIGAYLLLTFQKFWGWPYYAALFSTLIVAGILGYAVFDRLVSRPMMTASLLSRVIALMGLASIIKGVVRLVWGADAFYLSSPFPTKPIIIGPVEISVQELAIVAITSFVLLALYLFFRHTKAGMAMRATSQNRRAAALMGVNIAGVFAAAWIIGTALSALGGAFLGPLLLVDPDMGSIAFKSFTAVVLGGFGSIPGALLGGVLLGVVENLAGGYIRSDLQIGASFILLIAVLAIRPTGLLGKPLQKRV